jgi:hypothetical protein
VIAAGRHVTPTTGEFETQGADGAKTCVCVGACTASSANRHKSCGVRPAGDAPDRRSDMVRRSL